MRPRSPSLDLPAAWREWEVDMLNIVRFSDLSELQAVKTEWEELLAQSPRASVFMTWEWLVTWWEVYGGDHELWWLVARNEGGKAVGGAPFYVRKHQNGLVLPHRELRFVGTGAAVSPEHLDIVALASHAGEAVKSFARYLADHFSKWDVLSLADISDPSALAFQLAQELREKGAGGLAEEQIPGASYVPLPVSWEGYLKSLGKWMRRDIIRGRNKLNREHQIRFHVWSPSDGSLEDAFQEFQTLFAARKESTGFGNKFKSENGYQKFHRRLAERFAERGWLYLVFLRIHGKAVAAEYTFKYLKSLYSYQTGFDPALGKENVFKVLRSYAIEDAIRQGLVKFDLLRGGESYKQDWKAIPRKKYKLKYFSPTFYGRTLNGVLRLRRFGAQTVRRLGLAAPKG